MNKVQFLLSTCIVFASAVIAKDDISKNEMATNRADQADKTDKAGKVDLTAQDDPNLVKAVEEALKAIKMESPQVHEDSLRVWRNFKSTSKPVNYTYRFWGRRLILWLKEDQKTTFDTEKKVGDVFNILYHKGLISANAVLVLTVDVWSHLVYLEGSPDWEKRLENRSPEGGTTPTDSDKGKSNERAV